MIVLDYSAQRLTGDVITGYKARGAIRYAGLPETNVKIVNKTEVTSILNAGLSLALVFEQYATDAYGGYAQGQANATKLKNHALALGLPARGYLCQDQWIASGRSTDVLAYFQGAISVLGTKNTGIYGFSDTMDLTKNLNAGAYWQCGAQTELRPWASVYQRNYGAYAVGGIAVDVNDVIKSDWLQSPQTQQQTIEVNDMQVIRCDELGLTGILDGGRFRGVSAATDSANPAALFPRFYVTKEDWNQLVTQSAQVDNLTFEFGVINGKFDVLTEAVTRLSDNPVKATGTLSVSGQLNVS